MANLWDRMCNWLDAYCIAEADARTAHYTSQAWAKLMDADVPEPFYFHGVANPGGLIDFTLVSERLMANPNSIVRRVQLWKNNTTGHIHVTAQNYMTPAGSTKEDFPFSVHDTGCTYTDNIEAMKDFPFDFVPVVYGERHTGVEVSIS